MIDQPAVQKWMSLGSIEVFCFSLVGRASIADGGGPRDVMLPCVCSIAMVLIM